MRVLVVGSLPPPERARAESLRDEVVDLLAEGHTVEVVALEPFATAHRYLAASGLPGCLQLATMVRGFDSVVVQIEPGLPVRPRAGQLERAVSLRAFVFALRRARRVDIRIESLEDLPGGPAGRAALGVWRSAEQILIASEDERDRFIEAVGKHADRLAVSCRAPRATDEGEEGSWGIKPDGTLADVLELVRKRAARERRALASSDAVHFSGWDRLATPGLAMTESDVALLGPPEGPRKPADLARKALAAADRRPSLWRFARAARLARRGAYAVLRRDDAD